MSKKLQNNQRGVALIITFMITTIMLSLVLGLTSILLSKIKILQNIGNYLSSSYAAESGIEETLYLDRKQIPKKSSRGLCNICSSCENCSNCTATPLVSGGCNVSTCNNCQVKYDFTFNARTYTVDAKVIPGSFFSCVSRGNYSNTSKLITVTATSLSSLPQEQ